MVHVIALVPSSGYRRVVVERQAAGGSVAAVESVLQVDPRLADDVVGPDDIVVQHHHDQLRLQREGHREFKDPERRRETVGRADGLCGSGAGRQTGTDSPNVGLSCLGMYRSRVLDDCCPARTTRYGSDLPFGSEGARDVACRTPTETPESNPVHSDSGRLDGSTERPSVDGTRETGTLTM